MCDNQQVICYLLCTYAVLFVALSNFFRYVHIDSTASV